MFEFGLSLAMYLNNECLFLSLFRINNDFSFDDAMAEHYKCFVRAFDPR